MSAKPSVAIVVPLKDKASVAENCLRSIACATREDPDTSLIVVDHASTDGTLEIVNRVSAGCFAVLQIRDGHVGRVRNLGAAATSSDWLIFLDGDCVVPADFVARFRAVLRNQDVAVTGCEVGLPGKPNWIEAAWDVLTRRNFEGAARWLNSACFAVRRDVFDAVGGFDETRTSSEDVDICDRLKARGFVLWQSLALQVEHHGNPQSVSGFYRRLRWHGEGVIDDSGAVQQSATLYLVMAHALSFCGAAAGLALPVLGLISESFVAAGLLPLFIPTLAFVRGLIRAPVLPTATRAAHGYLLMNIAYFARVHGFFRAVRKQLRSR